MLLVQSCSATKSASADATPALELYDGYFYKIINKAIREAELRSNLHLRILSAKHGILHPETPIETYDYRMDCGRARDLRETVLSDIQDSVATTDANRVVVNVGDTYRQALDGLEGIVDADVFEIPGNGIGEKGHQLKRVIRGDDSPLARL